MDCRYDFLTFINVHAVYMKCYDIYDSTHCRYGLFANELYEIWSFGTFMNEPSKDIMFLNIYEWEYHDNFTNFNSLSKKQIYIYFNFICVFHKVLWAEQAFKVEYI